jgi:hypothetical protein
MICELRKINSVRWKGRVRRVEETEMWKNGKEIVDKKKCS